MKNKLVVFVLYTLLYTPLFSIANNDTLKVESKIREVTVYLKGALLQQSAEVFLPQGETYLLFTNLAADLNPNSIQVKCSENITILSVLKQDNFFEQPKKKAEVKLLEQSIKDLEDKIALQQSLLLVYKHEEELITLNKSMSNTEKGVQIDELKKAVLFVREKLTEIKIKQLEISNEITVLNKNLQNQRNQLLEISAKNTEKVSEIMIKVNNPVAKNTTINVLFYVPNAGWIPKYDLRASDVNSPIDLSYKAEVWQKTGADWTNVQLVLSTADPLLSGTKPDIQTWYVRESYQVKTDAYTKTTKSASARFNIENPYTIPTNGKTYTVEVIRYSIPAYFEYHCIPKLDEDAFLIAKVANWEQYSFLNGEVNLFFEGTYVGKSALDVGKTDDTIHFSLGRDKNVIVKRTKLTDYSSKQLLGSKKVELFAYEISMRNNKKTTINLVIEDQFPVSQDKEISVEQIENSGAKPNEVTGKLIWYFKLEPSDNKKITLKYSIKYPKDLIITFN